MLVLAITGGLDRFSCQCSTMLALKMLSPIILLNIVVELSRVQENASGLNVYV